MSTHIVTHTSVWDGKCLSLSRYITRLVWLLYWVVPSMADCFVDHGHRLKFRYIYGQWLWHDILEHLVTYLHV